jgi:hypothetical protein
VGWRYAVRLPRDGAGVVRDDHVAGTISALRIRQLADGLQKTVEESAYYEAEKGQQKEPGSRVVHESTPSMKRGETPL